MRQAKLRLTGYYIAACFSGLALTGVGATVPVTQVDTAGEKVTLRVDGKPFFYNGVQVSTHRLENKAGWSWASNDMAVLFQTAARDGFTVITCPLLWSRIETAPDVFDWSALEKAIDHATTCGIKLEFLWYGSNLCGSYNAVPKFYDSFQKVLKRDGAISLHKNLYKYDLCDPRLLAREQALLTQVMDHIARYTSARRYPTTVIGMQVLNEPTVVTYEGGTSATDRSYSDCANRKWKTGGYTNATAFNTDVLWEYLEGLAKAIKQSSYPVWTRVNFCDIWEKSIDEGVIAKNESERASGGTALDFIGNDPYTKRTKDIFRYCTDSSRYNRGKNLVMVMENGGAYSNTDMLIFNALAGNGVYNIWELCDSGTGSLLLGNQGLYTLEANRTLLPKKHVQSVRDFMTMINKDKHDLATLKAGGGRLRFFNRTFLRTFSGTETIHGQAITYASTNTGGGIVAAGPGRYVFMSTAAGSFRLPSSLAMASLQKGYFDSNDTWVDQGAVSCQSAGNETTFAIEAYDCIRLACAEASNGLPSPGFSEAQPQQQYH